MSDRAPSTSISGTPGLGHGATLALAAAAAGAIAWWWLSAPTPQARRGPFDWNRDTVPAVSDEDLALLQAYTGAQELQVLRRQLLRWWKDVKRRVHVYKCIQEMMFLHSRIDQHKAYKALKYLAAQPSGRQTLRVADVGCCFGQDTRRMILDGVPASSIWAIDLTPDYWEAAKQLWGDDKPGSRIEGVHTLFGDMAAVPRTPSAVDLEGEQLLGTFRFVSAMAVLHCLKCERFLSRCKTMLEPGKGVLFGYCVGTTEPEGVTWAARPSPDVVENELHTRFLHSATSLQQLLERLGYGEVEVTTMERNLLQGPEGGSAASTFEAKALRNIEDGRPKMQLLSFMAKRLQ